MQVIGKKLNYYHPWRRIYPVYLKAAQSDPFYPIFSLCFKQKRPGQESMGRTAHVGFLPVANVKRQVLCAGLMGCGTAPLTSSLTLVAEDSVSDPRSDRSLMGSHAWLLSRSSTPVLCHSNFLYTPGVL